MKQGRESTEVYCTVCDCYISIKYKGAFDIDTHIKSNKHKNQLLTVSKTRKIDTIFQSASSQSKTKESAAEATLAFHTVKHHQSYNSMDCTGRLMKVIFPDSNTAKDITCQRTKTEAIINGAIAPWIIQNIKSILQNITYIGVSTDASNHGSEKIFPILIQFFDCQGGIQSKLLDVVNTPNETAETISDIIMKTLQKYDLTEKCISLTADNANVNFGGINRQAGRNVLTNLKNKLNKEIVGIGCPAHILHNCVQHGTDVLKIDIESLVMKLFNFFSVYTVRTEALKSICEYIDIHYTKLLYHSKTRWLSLFPAVERILKMYLPLKEYFLTTPQVPTIIKTFFENELAESYLFFVHSLMSVFQSQIAKIERENNSVMDIVQILNLTRETLKARAGATFVPLKVRELMSNWTQDAKETFIKDVKDAYNTCIDYLDKWLQPLDEFKIFDWMMILKNVDVDYEKVVSSMQFINGYGVCLDDVKLFDEITALNSFVKQQSNDFFEIVPVKQWEIILKSVSCERLTELNKICCFVFAIQAQNANVERVFSLMGAQWTKERNRLSIASVKALLLTQFNLKTTSCEDFHKIVMKDEQLLKAISGSKKYEPDQMNKTI